MLNSPFRFTVVTVACSAVIVAGFLASELRPVYSSLPLLSVCFLSVVAGVIGMYWTSFTLREDVRNDRWSDEVLAPFRTLTTHVLWYLGMAVLVIAMLFTWVHRRHHSPFLWVFLFLLQTQSQLTSAFAKPRKPSGSGHRIEWNKFSPLQSEHWGER